MIFPTEQAKCSICTENTVDVRLHKQRQCDDEPCRCIQFLMCLECLLRWYWESSEQLQKSFSTCPTCRATFRLEDIVRVHWPFDTKSSVKSNGSGTQAAVGNANDEENSNERNESVAAAANTGPVE